MISSLVGEIVMVTEASKLTKEDALDHYTKVEKNLGLDIDLVGGSLTASASVHDQLKELFVNLDARLNYPFHVNFLEEDENKIIIRVQITNNQMLTLKVSKKRIANPTTYIYVLIMAATSIILFFIAVIFTKNQIRSITNLSNAMARYGKKMEDAK